MAKSFGNCHLTFNHGPIEGLFGAPRVEVCLPALADVALPSVPTPTLHKLTNGGFVVALMATKELLAGHIKT